METVKSYFIVVGLYIFFMLISFKYSPLSDAINAPSYQPVFDGEKFLDISIASIREMFKEDSATIRKILIYGIEQYLDIFEYPYCTVDPDFQNNQQWPQSIQFVVSYISTGWIFLIFQRITGRVTDDFCYREDGHTISFIVKMSYTFYVENIIGYIAQITIYWMQRIVLSKPVSYILDFFYKLALLSQKISDVFGNLHGIFLNVILLILFPISMIVSIVLLGVLVNVFEALGGITGALKKIYGFTMGPYIVFGIQFFVYLLWVGFNSLLLNLFDSVQLINKVIHLRHFGILYFVFIVVLFWKDTIDPAVSKLLSFLLNEYILFGDD